MKIMDIITSASSNLMRNKGRTILTIVAIFIGAFTISLTIGINSGINNYIDKQVNSVGGEDAMIIYAQSDSMSIGGNKSEVETYNPDAKGSEISLLKSKDIDTIKKIKGIKTAEPFLIGSIDYITTGNEKFVFSGMETHGDFDLELKAGEIVASKTTGNKINISPEYVKALGFKKAKDIINQTVTLGISSSATGEQKEVSATIVGVRSPSLIQGGQSIISRSLMKEIIAINEAGLPENMTNQYQALSATFDASMTSDELAKMKETLSDKGYVGQTTDDEIGMIRNVINAITGVLTMFGAIALLAASFGIINTLYMSVQDRTREIGLMKAMGLSSFKVFSMFSFEALLIGFWGSVIGILGAMGAGSLINKFATNSFLDGLEGLTLIQITPTNILIITLIIMLIAFFSGTLPARKAAKMDPIDSLRYE